MIQVNATYRFIEMVRHESVPFVWVVRNKRTKAALGGIQFYKPWREYVFSADESAVFSRDCLRDIADFIRDQNNRRRLNQVQESR